jgi:hypothetical protein
VPKDDLNLSHLLARALSLFAPRPWTPLSEAARRAGLDTLVSGVQSGDIVGRYNGIRHRGGLEARTALVPLSWWKNITDDDVRANRLQVDLDVLGRSFVTGIEVEKAGLDAAIANARAADVSTRGAKTQYDWEGARQHIDAHVAEHGRFDLHVRVAEEFERYFEKRHKRSPTRTRIFEWLRKNPHPTWVK